MKRTGSVVQLWLKKIFSSEKGGLNGDLIYYWKLFILYGYLMNIEKTPSNGSAFSFANFLVIFIFEIFLNSFEKSVKKFSTFLWWRYLNKFKKIYNWITDKQFWVEYSFQSRVLTCLKYCSKWAKKKKFEKQKNYYLKNLPLRFYFVRTSTLLLFLVFLSWKLSKFQNFL